MGTGLIDLDAIAELNKVPRATLRTWYRRGRIKPAACDVRNRRLLFDVTEMDKQVKRREEAVAA